MNRPVVSDDTIVQEITIKAPAGRIFAALTNPNELLKWWTAEGKFRASHVETDARPGGKWQMRVVSDRAPEVLTTTVRGEYRTIEPPTLLVFTWIRDEENQAETLVRWDLEEHGAVTTVRLTHSGLTTDRLLNRNNGWPFVVTLLQCYLEKQG
jgi:uncharacterized protein YndB with AHSA1/START domain